MIPLATIAKYEKVDRQNTHFMFGGENSYSVDIFTKDFRRPIRFALEPSKHSRREICNYLSKYIFPQSLQDVFAISSKQLLAITKSPTSTSDHNSNNSDSDSNSNNTANSDSNSNNNIININGWEIYNPVEDYKRMGVGESDCPWQPTDANINYSLCESYPRFLIIPNGVSLADLLVIYPSTHSCLLCCLS